MVRTIWNDEERRTLADRVARLRPDSKGQWGTLSAPQMVVHITDAVRMGIGELTCAPKASPLRYPGINALVMFYLPWPKSAPTAPELLARKAEGWDAEVARFTDALERFAAKPKDAAWPIHAAFGKLSGAQWGRLMHRHIEHHLTQFGV